MSKLELGKILVLWRKEKLAIIQIRRIWLYIGTWEPDIPEGKTLFSQLGGPKL